MCEGNCDCKAVKTDDGCSCGCLDHPIMLICKAGIMVICTMIVVSIFIL
jgi:hypothetical protein